MEEITFDYFEKNFDKIMKVLETEERGYFLMTPDGNRVMLLPVNQSEELKALIYNMQQNGAIEEFK
ncbi:MAG: hypothetical protein EBR67_09140 [Proteobacteria bacterium]|nr:hypothetical protein [Pseudomonadota bacterium]